MGPRRIVCCSSKVAETNDGWVTPKKVVGISNGLLDISQPNALDGINLWPSTVERQGAFTFGPPDTLSTLPPPDTGIRRKSEQTVLPVSPEFSPEHGEAPPVRRQMGGEEPPPSPVPTAKKRSRKQSLPKAEA